MKKKLKWILAALVVVFALLQFANPPRTNPPVAPGHDLMATNAPPPEIAALLHAACYDCHSQETKWPWYSHIAPVSWLVANDVTRGRERLNFSDWPRECPNARPNGWNGSVKKWTTKICRRPNTRSLHPEARLTADQRQQLIHWADQEAARLKANGGAGTE